jgi:hypothetical protein
MASRANAADKCKELTTPHATPPICADPITISDVTRKRRSNCCIAMGLRGGGCFGSNLRLEHAQQRCPLLDYLIRKVNEGWTNIKSEPAGQIEVDRQIYFRRTLNWEVGWLSTF